MNTCVRQIYLAAIFLVVIRRFVSTNDIILATSALRGNFISRKKFAGTKSYKPILALPFGQHIFCVRIT